MNLEMIQANRAGMILRFSVPSIIAMILTSMITVADGFFIGNYVDEAGLAAVNLGLPIIYLYIAVGLMISVGGMVIAGMALGAGDIKKCNNVFNQTMATVTAAMFILSAAVYFFLEPMLSFLRADEIVAGYFMDYYTIMLFQLPIMVINASFGMFIRGEGKPQYFMRLNAANVLINILLNYLFVRHFGWGIKGIAFASLMSTSITSLRAVRFFTRKSEVYKFGRFIFSDEVLKRTLFNGSSEFIGEMSLSISMFAYNFVILKNIGVDGVTAFTVVGYLAYIFSMILIGFGQGTSPLISFSYGAGEARLAARLRRLTNFMVLAAGAVTFLFVVLGSGWYGSLFVKSEIVRQMINSGMIIFAVSFLFSGVNVISSFYFTSIGKAIESAVISSARGLVFLLSAVFILPPLMGMTGVWLVAPAAEVLTMFLSLLFIFKERKQGANIQNGKDRIEICGEDL